MTSRPTLDEVYLTMLREFARRSTCARRQVACIFADHHGVVLSCGYNGVPRGYKHCIDDACPGALDPHGDNRNCYAVHAEQNAILQCIQLDKVHTVYCSCTPCFECAKMLVNLPNFDRLVVTEAYADKRGADLLKEYGVEITILEPNEPIHNIYDSPDE